MATLVRSIRCALFSLTVWGILSGLHDGLILGNGVDDRQPKDSQATELDSGTDGKTDTKVDETTAIPGSAPVTKTDTQNEDSKYPPASEVLKDAEKISGLIPLYRKDQNLFAELTSSHLDQDYIILITIAKGIGRMPILGGISWGDDAVWQFRKVGEQIHVVRRNLRFTADKNSPEAKAVELAYTDSVLFSLPITTKSPSGATIVDLTPVFMSDLPQIGMVLSGFSFAPSRSTWADIKGHPQNIELQVAATYASSGAQDIESVADTRGVTVNVHYSISKLPETGYKPRLADDRIGYFLTVIKDFSKKSPDDRFVRYINRWDLQKADPNAELSPPKQPIIFWLEKSIPFQYRKPIRDGILEWNKAFEKAGFVNAVEVRQQPDDATWEPGDINYNTFRWITAGQGFAMGPSRVNPRTGQILDADIIFDADFLQYWKQEYETFTPKGISLLTGGPVTLDGYYEELRRNPYAPEYHHGPLCACDLLAGKAYQLALTHAVMTARTQSKEDFEKLVMQALKDTTMHEVGHTLGLRHNFKASTYYSIEEANDVSKTSQTGLTASIMDYTPVNIVPKDMTQGDYYSTTIGPYDLWAIEYGYKPVSGSSPEGELEELKKIAARSGEPGHAYATDEDARGIDPDPTVNRWDFTKDPLAYAKLQAKLVAEAWPEIVDRLIEDGEGYQRPRRAFNVLLATHGRAMFFVARYIGGLQISRSHKGDKDGKLPFTVVPASEQRDALALLETEVFGDKPFQFPPELYNQLAASHWDHWGTEYPDRTDLPVHEIILMWQDRILDQLLSPWTLTRLHDSELKVPADEDAFTAAELIAQLTQTIFSEVESITSGEYTNRKPAISSLRRNLQRSLLMRLSNLALGNTSAPQDCGTVAYIEMKKLRNRIGQLMKKKDIQLDRYSQAHLAETADRINKVLKSQMIQFP